MIQQLAKDGKLPLTVVRAGKALHIELPVSARSIRRWSTDLHGDYPPYFIYGPLVFSTATWQMISSVENNAGMLRALGFVKSPLITRATRSARCRPGGAGGRLLAVLPAQARERLFESGGLGGVLRQRHAHHEPQAPGRGAARSQGSVRDLRVRPEEAARRWCSRARRSSPPPRRSSTDNGVRAQGSPDTLAVWQAKPAE